jgi:hypothetical protein
MFKVGGFIATLATGALMVGSAVTGTGAYFSDSKTGTIAASSGHLTLSTSNTALKFDNLMPGEDKTDSVDFGVNSTGKSDVWLVFTKDTGYAAWTGPLGEAPYPAGGMGRYGHVQIGTSEAPNLFESWNLQNLPAGSPNTTCTVNQFGWGHGTPSTSHDDTPALCGVPGSIKIASNLTSGAGGTLNITFGITGRSTGQNKPVAAVNYQIVATQAGILPDAPNF